LYLPPHLAHWGIAVSNGAENCMTYSIGFRAPKNQELTTEFLGFMQDKLNQDKLIWDDDFLTKIYQDADLTLQTHSAEISQAMMRKVSTILQKIKWSDDLVAEFLGTYLSEPKIDVVFDKNKKMAMRAFSEKIAKLGIALSLKSQMLFFNESFFMNGELTTFEGVSVEVLKTLADNRRIDACVILDEVLLQQLLDWYIAGYLYFSV